MSGDEKTVDRRNALLGGAMWGSLALGYGVGGVHALRYLVPLGAKTKHRELFVGPVDQLKVGESRKVTSPSGATYVMARTGPESFRVLSDICPHLGCRVHWDGSAKQFICPCHMGIFDAEGRAISGPPAEADQRLPSLETVIRGRSVFLLIKES